MQHVPIVINLFPIFQSSIVIAKFVWMATIPTIKDCVLIASPTVKAVYLKATVLSVTQALH